ncbi:MFS transporter [Clostridium sp.]|uniref:MDR family MFS transporter n=1 Tax=Clostridium sp. TaxID=1506 RepID=UPI001A621FBB|nr:MFS transporter [Clostridium sp.]MBK5235580.1 MFS transporter [Clostridium sp.]
MIKLRCFDTYKGLPKSIYIIFLAQVTNRFGDFVIPFLTLFLVKKMGLTYESAGFAVMLTALTSIPGSFAGGHIADHIGRKKTYAIFQLTAGFFVFLCVFFNNPQIIIALICISSFFNGGVRPILSAIITDVLPAEKRQIGFSISYLGINLGAALGPLVAGFLFNHYIPLIFIGDAITSLIAVTLVVLNINESLPDYDINECVRNEEQSEVGNVFSVLVKRPKILVFLIINIFLSFTYTQNVFSLPIMLDYVFGSRGAENYGILISFNAMTVLVMTIFITSKIRKWHPLSAIAIAGILYAIGFGMITFIQSMPFYILSTLIWTIGEIMVVTNFGVYIANNTPQNFRARFSAVTTLSFAIGAALGTSLMGKYMDILGVKAVWPLIFFLSLFGAVGMYILKIKTEENIKGDIAPKL